MRSETEIKWIANIYMSSHVKSLFKKNIPLSKLGFEKLCKAPERNKLFSEWFDFLIEESIFEYTEIKIKKQKYKGYLADREKLLGLLKHNDSYKPFYYLFDDIITKESTIKI